jgi:hypothetical protein
VIRAAVVALAAIAAVCLAGGTGALAAPGIGADLGFLVDHDVVQVSVDTARFAGDRVAAIRITNRQPFVVRGFIGACRTIFTASPAHSPIRPAESGPFVVGPKETVTIVRLFALVDRSKQAPGSAPYRWDDEAEAEPGCRD